MEPEMEVQEIDLRELIYMVLRKWWLLAIFFIVSVVAAGLISYFVLQPVYVSTTTLFVGRQQGGEGDTGIQYSDIMLNQQLVKDYRELAKSRMISREVIDKMGLTMSVGQLTDKVTVNMRQDTRVFELSITDTDPVLATDIANELAEVFIQKATEIMKVENIQVIDIAEVPINPVKPNPKLNMAIAGVLGLMIALGIIFLIEYMDNTIKTPNDVEKYLQLNVIGAIPMIEMKEEEE